MIEQRGSWLDQIAREKNLRFSPKAPVQMDNKVRKRLTQVNQQIKALSQRIEKLQKEGNDEQVRQLQKQCQRLRDRIAQVRGEPMDKEDAPTVDDGKSLVDREGLQLVRQAYLRTLSRNPDERELTQSLAYLRDSETVADGLRDLVWALLNTKEFMVNH